MFDQSVLNKLESLDSSNARYFSHPTLSLSDKETYYVNKSHFAIFGVAGDTLGYLAPFSDIFTLAEENILHVFPALSVEEKDINEKPDFHVIPNSLSISFKNTTKIPTAIPFLKEAGIDMPNDLDSYWSVLPFTPGSEGYVSVLLKLKSNTPRGVRVFERRVAEPTYFY